MQWATGASGFCGICCHALPPTHVGLTMMGDAYPAFAYGFTLGFMLTACSAG